MATKVEPVAAPQTHLDRVLGEVVLSGDLHSLSEQDRIRYYLAVCEATGLTPATRPFAYLELGDDRGGKKLTLYATKDATDQLRRIHRISVQVVSRERVDDVYLVVARATMPDGRMDESVGAVPLVREDGEWRNSSNGKRYFAPNGKLIPLKPDQLANALMKAETKSKRRATLAICGLGMLDESEIETIPHATQVDASPAIQTTPATTTTTQAPALPAPAPATTQATETPSAAQPATPPEQKPSKVSGPALKRLQELIAKASSSGISNVREDLETIFGTTVEALPIESYTHALSLLTEAFGKSVSQNTREKLSRSINETNSDLDAFCQYFGCKSDLSDMLPRHLLAAAALLARKERSTTRGGKSHG